MGALAQGVGAGDRWRGMRQFGGAGGTSYMLWWVLIAFGILVVIGAIAAVLYVRRRGRQKWDKFRRQGRGSGLREKELTLLEHVMRMANLKDPAAVYIDGDVFNYASLGLLSSKRVAALSEKVQLGLQTTLISIHAKLGFGRIDDGDDLGIFRSSHQIEVGSRVFVTMMGDLQSVEAIVSRNGHNELLLTSEKDLPGRREGDVLTIRYARGHGAWEFDARVIRCEGRAVAVEHSLEMRSVNFRRFPRISTRMRAARTTVPFHIDSCEASLEFQPADIVEVAGPGLLIRMSIEEVEVGQNMLIRVQLDEDKFIQGMTKVRRMITDKPGGPFVAVEFVELSARELNELTRATNRAAKHNSRTNAEAKMSMA